MAQHKRLILSDRNSIFAESFPLIHHYILTAPCVQCMSDCIAMIVTHPTTVLHSSQGACHFPIIIDKSRIIIIIIATVQISKRVCGTDTYTITYSYVK